MAFLMRTGRNCRWLCRHVFRGHEGIPPARRPRRDHLPLRMACAEERQDHRPPPLHSRRKRQERRGRLWRERAESLNHEIRKLAGSYELPVTSSQFRVFRVFSHSQQIVNFKVNYSKINYFEAKHASASAKHAIPPVFSAIFHRKIAPFT